MKEENINIDDMITKIHFSSASKSKFQLSENQIIGLCSLSKKILYRQSSLLQLNPPIIVCGDIHGQFDSLKTIFSKIGSPEENNFIFLGDYVDRGQNSLQCICLLLAYKIKYPVNFFLLRGNHESTQLNKIYGFYDQCKRRATLKSWKALSDCFNFFPYAAVIGTRIFCVHGGLSPHMENITEICHIKRPTEIQQGSIISDLVWSDPKPTEGWSKNKIRNISFCYGPDVVEKFLQKYGFDLLCRSHQVVQDGYEFSSGKRVLTLFSAANYCQKFNNNGCVLQVQQDMKCHIHQLYSNMKTSELKRSTTPFGKGCGNQRGITRYQKPKNAQQQ